MWKILEAVIGREQCWFLFSLEKKKFLSVHYTTLRNIIQF